MNTLGLNMVGAGGGLLVWDRDGNGVIDSGAELFGFGNVHSLHQTVVQNLQEVA